MNSLYSFFRSLNNALWDPVLLLCLCGTGVYFTVRLRFIQVRKFGAALRQAFGSLFRRGSKGQGISSFQALATAIAAQVGTGNLAGAATAIASGGPGAVFWMWACAFFGMATTYVEAVMAQRFRTKRDGQVTGGPVYYIRAAFPGLFGRLLAGAFALLLILALGFMGSMVQSNSIGSAFSAAFGINPILVGAVVALMALLVFAGGIQRIASLTGKLVPLMALFYIGGALAVILANAGNVLPALRSIFVGAFAPQALAGGVLGVTVKKAVRFGVARGLFSNESGMGSTPHAHAIAQVSHPVEQGYVAMLGVFVDTFVILTLTALVILTTGVLTPDGSLQGTALTQAGFSAVFGPYGAVFIAVCMFFFAFSSIVGWYFFGEINVRYLFGARGVKPYCLLACCCIVLGAGLRVELVWEMADACNGLMALPNLLALLALGGLASSLTREYDRPGRRGKPQ